MYQQVELLSILIENAAAMQRISKLYICNIQHADSYSIFEAKRGYELQRSVRENKTVRWAGRCNNACLFFLLTIDPSPPSPSPVFPPRRYSVSPRRSFCPPQPPSPATTTTTTSLTALVDKINRRYPLWYK